MLCGTSYFRARTMAREGLLEVIKVGGVYRVYEEGWQQLVSMSPFAAALKQEPERHAKTRMPKTPKKETED